MVIEHIRLSQQARDQLLKLKRNTGIEHWNVLCRWAFCLSLAEPSPPSSTKVPADSSLEMTWKVFGGPHHPVYDALLRQRCREDSLENTEEVLATQFRLHLHRGIGYLAADRKLKGIANLFSNVLLHA